MKEIEEENIDKNTHTPLWDEKEKNAKAMEEKGVRETGRGDEIRRNRERE